MTWPLFLVFIVCVIALFFVLSVGFPRFFGWFSSLFLKNSVVNPYGKLPTFRHRNRRLFSYILLCLLGSALIKSSPALAYCDPFQSGPTNWNDCAMWSFEQNIYGVTMTLYHTNQYPSPDQAFVVTTSYATGPLGVNNSDWSNNQRIGIALGFSLVVVLFLDLCRRIILPKTW